MISHFETVLQVQPYDKDHWFLLQSLKYHTLHWEYPKLIEVPAYVFPTDFASIPHFLRPIIRRTAATHRAAVIHDWLTWRNPKFKKRGEDGITRSDADKIFLEALLAGGVPRWKAYTMYNGVRLWSFIGKR